MKYNYDKENDILYIYDDKETFRGSLDVFPGFIVDVNHQGKVIALEIIDASNLLEIPKKWLNDLKKIKLATIIREGYYGFVFSAVANAKQINYQVAAPLSPRRRIAVKK